MNFTAQTVIEAQPERRHVDSAYSMRTRIMLGLVVAVAAIMGIAGVASYRVALHEADEIFSARLATSARVLDTLLAQQIEHATIEKPIVIHIPGGLKDADPEDPSPSGHPYETKLAFQVWNHEGRLLVRSEYAPDQRLGFGREGFFERHVGERDWHVFAMDSQDGHIWIEVAEEMGLRAEIAGDVGVVLSSPLFIGFVVLLVVVNLIVIAGFRPLSKLAETIESRDPKDTSPVALDRTPNEILPVVEALNRLLDRMAHVMSRERRFTDSAAHELRTPLAALSVHAQNISSARNEEEQAVSLAHLMTGLNRTKHLVEQMLTYSRIHSDLDGEVPGPVNLNEELRYLVNNQRAVLEGTGLHIALSLPEQVVTIQARKGLLEMMIRNLLDNACKYTLNPAEPVEIGFNEVDAHTLTLTVSNSAEPMTTDQAQQIFEPYYRIPNARQKGNGLGLAIVKEVVELHGWSLALSQGDGRFNIVVSLYNGEQE
ncbi:ATP-binding protein [Limnobacter humi]|uniref:histidine kinase n=1 Tax=Limnobacter humi TaxID=1778671 RepID=A0ABT1WJK9_9BURK|nr:ATP-binding protein [Limnobacter humi]MCQ8897705.1 ATP-binding protein [Limnobacter humi]